MRHSVIILWKAKIAPGAAVAAGVSPEVYEPN
jgi:hypothetical protein